MRRVVIALGAVGVVSGAGVLLALMLGDDREYVCAGVGRFGPAAATPEGAIDLYAVQEGGTGADWEAVGDDTFALRDGVPELLGFERLGVDEVQPGVWRVTGGCVGPV